MSIFETVTNASKGARESLADPASPWLTIRQPDEFWAQQDQGQNNCTGHGGKRYG